MSVLSTLAAKLTRVVNVVVIGHKHVFAFALHLYRCAGQTLFGGARSAAWLANLGRLEAGQGGEGTMQGKDLANAPKAAEVTDVTMATDCGHSESAEAAIGNGLPAARVPDTGDKESAALPQAGRLFDILGKQDADELLNGRFAPSRANFIGQTPMITQAIPNRYERALVHEALNEIYGQRLAHFANPHTNRMCIGLPDTIPTEFRPRQTEKQKNNAKLTKPRVDNKQRGPAAMNRGPATINRRSGPMDRGPATMNHGPANAKPIAPPKGRVPPAAATTAKTTIVQRSSPPEARASPAAPAVSNWAGWAAGEAMRQAYFKTDEGYREHQEKLAQRAAASKSDEVQVEYKCKFTLRGAAEPSSPSPTTNNTVAASKSNTFVPPHLLHQADTKSSSPSPATNNSTAAASTATTFIPPHLRSQAAAKSSLPSPAANNATAASKQNTCLPPHLRHRADIKPSLSSANKTNPEPQSNEFVPPHLRH